jgi:hypothetical protein
MASEWYYTKDGIQHGPISTTEIKGLAKSNLLSPIDMVWKEGMSEWRKAGSIKDLFQTSTLDENFSPPPIPNNRFMSSENSQKAKQAFFNTTNELRFDWGNWRLGGKLIFISSCTALLTMFMKWVDLGIASSNGFRQGAFVLLGLFVYPLVKLLKNDEVDKLKGVLCGAVGIVFAVIYIASNQLSIMGRRVNVSGEGPYIFIIVCSVLIVGVNKYQKERA